MIVFLHNLSDDALEAHKPKLRDVCERVGIPFDDEHVRFERALEAAATGFDGVVHDIEAFTSGSRTETPAQLDAGFSLRETAWQRRNRGAPWYRQFQPKRRHS